MKVKRILAILTLAITLGSFGAISNPITLKAETIISLEQSISDEVETGIQDAPDVQETNEEVANQTETANTSNVADNNALPKTGDYSIADTLHRFAEQVVTFIFSKL